MPDGSMQVIENPELCRCPSNIYAPLRRDTMPAQAQSQKMPLFVYEYPQLKANLGKCTGTAVRLQELSLQRELILSSVLGKNVFGMKINSFTLSIESTNGTIRSYNSSSSKLTPAMLSAIAELLPGSRLQFSNIRASNKKKKALEIGDFLLDVR